jgi:hypothetical protein
MAFLSERVGKFDMYVEDDDAVFISVLLRRPC